MIRKKTCVLLFCPPHGIHAAKLLTFRKTAPVKVLAVLHVSSTVSVCVGITQSQVPLPPPAEHKPLGESVYF